MTVLPHRQAASASVRKIAAERITSTVKVVERTETHLLRRAMKLFLSWHWTPGGSRKKPCSAHGGEGGCEAPAWSLVLRASSSSYLCIRGPPGRDGQID